MGTIVANAITVLITFLSVPGALALAGYGIVKGILQWSTAEAGKKADALWVVAGALLGAVLVFNLPGIWTALRAALGI